MNRRPFTLAELLVALLLTAVVIPVALRALTTISALGQSAAQHHQVAELADLQLRDLVLTGDWLEAEDSGDFGDTHPGYEWELETSTWTEGEVSLRRLDLTVLGPGRGRRAQVTVTTLVPEPGDE